MVDIDKISDGNVLHSTIQIGEQNYAVTAVSAEKVANKLTIKTAQGDINFDGSSQVELDLSSIDSGGGGGAADTIKVATDFGDKVYNASITISQEDPDGGNIGSIWFKY